MNDFNADVGRQAAQMPSCWRTDHKLAVAKAIVTNNAVHEVDQSARQFALDALPKSFRRGDQMPNNITPMAPVSLHDQQNGNTNNNYRNNRGAADQLTVPQVLDFVQACMQQLGEDQEQQSELVEGLADLLDFHLGGQSPAAAPTGSAVRLPIGWGSNLAALTAPEQSSNGSASARGEAWKDITDPPSATDGWRGPVALGRNGRDRRQAQDSARRVQQLEGFLSRFPDAARIRVW